IPEGTTSDQPIISVDLYPTFLEIARGQRPRGYALDGVNFLPTLHDPDQRIERDALYWHFPGYLGAGSGWRTTPAGAIREGDFKLLEFFEDHRIELYNLKDDIGQQHDLAQAESSAGVAKELHEKLVKWRQEIGAKMPTP